MPGPLDTGLEKPLVPSAETVDEREAFESPLEKQDEFLETPDEAAPAPVSAAEGVPAVAIPLPAIKPKDDVTIEVEKILEDDLGAFYATLPPQGKKLFKEKGETAATEISLMVRSLNLNFKRALRLIRDWLLTIPGVNKFFLEQEAKIKLDKLKDLVEVRREEASKQV